MPNAATDHLAQLVAVPQEQEDRAVQANDRVIHLEGGLDAQEHHEVHRGGQTVRVGEAEELEVEVGARFSCLPHQKGQLMQGLIIEQDPSADQGKGRFAVRSPGADLVKPLPSQLARSPAVVNNRPQGQTLIIPHGLSPSSAEHLKLSIDKGAAESVLKLREGAEANLQFLQAPIN